MTRHWMVLVLTSLFAGSTVFGQVTELSLEVCVSEALRSNPSLDAAAQRIVESRERARQARAANYPRLSASADYTGTDNPPQAFMMDLNQRSLNMASPTFDPNQPDDTTHGRLGLQVAYRLADGGQRGALNRQAEVGARMGEARHRLVRNELVYQVTESYYRVLAARAFSLVRQQAVESLTASLAVARERFDAGAAIKTDVLNLEVSLAQAEEEQIVARNGLSLSLAALNTAVGSELATEANLPPCLLQPGATLPQPPAASPSQGAIEGRPEWELAELQLERARAAEDAARAGRLPTVDLFGETDWDSEAFQNMERSYLAGVRVSWNLFSGGAVDAGVAAGAAAREAARRDVEQARNELALDAKRAALRVDGTRERVRVSAKSVASAEEALRITRNRYREGEVTLPDLLLAEVGLSTSRTRYVAAYYDHLTALADQRRATGELGETDADVWEKE